jgi:hypothetical protein
MPSRPAETEKTATQIEAESRARLDLTPTTGGCFHCPRVRFRGTAAQVMEMQAAHRAEVHPTLKKLGRRSKPATLHRIVRDSMTDEDRELTEAARQLRARLHGVDLESA